MFILILLSGIDFGSSVRKLIGAKSSTPPAAPVSRPATKLSGYFQRSSSATASGFRRVNQQQQQQDQQHLSSSSLGLSQGPPASVLPSDLCPSCLMPFDKNRKRRLIDSCGHERCYACLFSSELCPLCSPGKPASLQQNRDFHLNTPGGMKICESQKENWSAAAF